MAKPITIGTRTFPTKKAAEAAIREVLYRYDVGATLSSEDANFIYGVLEKHPEADEKIDCGVASFQVEQNGPTRGFWLTRLDGKRTDFSFPSCLAPPTPEKEALAGFRLAIRDQIVAFRNQAFGRLEYVPCAVTSELVSQETCHVDHASPTFRELVDQFVQSRSIALAIVKVVPTTDGSTETQLADIELRKAWYQFHHMNARLRIVTSRANLSILRKKEQ